MNCGRYNCSTANACCRGGLRRVKVVSRVYNMSMYAYEGVRVRLHALVLTTQSVCHRLLRAEMLLPSSFMAPYAPSSPRTVKSPSRSSSWTMSPKSPFSGSPRGVPGASADNMPAVPFVYDFLREDDCPLVQVMVRGYCRVSLVFVLCQNYECVAINDRFNWV